ncbi:FAD-dependent oxidoreductase [Dongia sp.]|uniref:oxidoreductase n=1 Tax=Dongia sp. TaxID=1977262 RepID=UPI00375171F8
MPRDPRYDILFEPVKIGPLTAKNRFYQVPHCNGQGYRDPSAMIKMRQNKAAGGWAVICTEQVEIHHTSEITPFIELRMWDDRDLPIFERIARVVHDQGALAGTELAYSGMNGANFTTRETPLGPSHLPIATFTYDPMQARAMDQADIRDLRRWHRNAAIRAKRAGFDIVYVYAAHGFSVFQHFLSRRYNHRSDEYGGSLENRMRLLREVTEDTKEAVGDTCAVAVRFAMEELMGPDGITKSEAEEVIGRMGEVPDLWDLTMGSWDIDSRTSRFVEEAGEEEYVRGVKALTSKPVVGVGRFTSPDQMVRQIKQGLLDFIGAARPSIADPFLPKKIEEGRIEDIRECIGCNICVSGDMTMSPSRCTQNPAMGEEWRKGWHPEFIRAKESEARVLIVGAGPAGLEAARALGQRGYDVALAEATTELGGRVAREQKLPGLSAWGRVKDYRALQLSKMANVEIFYDSRLDAAQVLEFGFGQVLVATGSTWRRDGVAHSHTLPMPIAADAEILTPDDLMAGKRPVGKTVTLYDDDHYYMGGVLAELLQREGFVVTLVTPATEVSNWARNTMEQFKIQARLLELGVEIVTGRAVSAVRKGGIETACVFTSRTDKRAADSVVMVTARLPNDRLYLDMKAREKDWADAGIIGVKCAGDAWAPSTIAGAVYGGRRYAEEMDAPPIGDALPFRREITELLPE